MTQLFRYSQLETNEKAPRISVRSDEAKLSLEKPPMPEGHRQSLGLGAVKAPRISVRSDEAPSGLSDSKEKRASPSELIRKQARETSSLSDSESELSRVDDVCDFCGSDNLETSGTRVCQDCGSILGVEIVSSADIQYSGNGDKEDIQNTVHNPLLNQFNYSTGVAGGSSYLQRLNLYSQVSYKEKTLARDFKRFDQICKQSQLPISVSHNAQLLYKEFLDLFRASDSGVKRPVGVPEACLYQACHDSGYSRTYLEIAEMMETTTTRVIRGLKAYQRVLNQKLSKANQIGDGIVLEYQSENTTDTYFMRFSDALGLDSEQKAQGLRLLTEIDRLHLLNESAASIVAGVLYLANTLYNFHLTKSLVAKQTGISELTITKMYRKMLPLIPDLELD